MIVRLQAHFAVLQKSKKGDISTVAKVRHGHHEQLAVSFCKIPGGFILGFFLVDQCVVKARAVLCEIGKGVPHHTQGYRV